MVSNVYAALDRIEHASKEGTSTLLWKVTFTVAADGDPSKVIVWLKNSTPDEEVLPLARAKLHRILQLGVEHTKDWARP